MAFTEEDRDKLISLVRQIVRLHQEVFSHLVLIREKARKIEMTTEEMVDVTYLVREFSRHAEDLRKECDALNEKVIAPIVCAAWAISSSDGAPIRGEIAVGSVKMNLGARLPAEGTPEWKNLWAYFGAINPHFIESKLLRIHYPTLMELVSGLAAEGKNPPPGINPADTYPIPGLVVRLRPGKRDPVRLEENIIKKFASKED